MSEISQGCACRHWRFFIPASGSMCQACYPCFGKTGDFALPSGWCGSLLWQYVCFLLFPRCALRRQDTKKRRIRLKGDASFYDCPSAVIPFKNSTFDGETIVELDRDSEFAWSDIMAVGRIGMKEAFEFRHYRNKVSVRVEDVLVWMDHCLLEPAHMETEGMFFFDGYTHQGTFYYYGSSEKTESVKMWHEASAKKWHRQHLFGLTEARAGICIRVLAKTAQDIEELFADLAEKLELDR